MTSYIEVKPVSDCPKRHLFVFIYIAITAEFLDIFAPLLSVELISNFVAFMYIMWRGKKRFLFLHHMYPFIRVRVYVRNT